MKNNFRKAFTELKALGVPVYKGSWNGNPDTFRISAEENDSEIWACAYFDWPGFDFGVNPIITKVLKKHGMYAEWANGGCLDVVME